MIIFFGDGRLGNQMFQMAFLRLIRKQSENIITLPMAQYDGVFGVTEGVLRLPYDFNHLFIRKFFYPLMRKVSNLGVFSKFEEDLDSSSGYKFFKGLVPGIKFVDRGYFQNYRIVTDDFIDSLHLPEASWLRAKKFLAQLDQQKTPVFIHVRKGDYRNEVFMGIKGIDLPDQYYKNAILLKRKELSHPVFIILSDEENSLSSITVNNPDFVYSSLDMSSDLALMALCEHGIISNSTFAWWGSRLMKRRLSVISPRYWYGWKVKVPFPSQIFTPDMRIVDVE